MSPGEPPHFAQTLESDVYKSNLRPQFKMRHQQFTQCSDTKFQDSKNKSSSMSLSSLNKSHQARHSQDQLCKQFKRGKRDFGENCKFARDNGTRDGGNFSSYRGDIRGVEGHVMRGRGKLCWWIVNGRRCPYGDDCVYSHPSAKNVEGNLALHRENVAITLVDPQAGTESQRRNEEQSWGFQKLNRYADQMQQNKPFWKTRLCYNWERNGSCPYGAKCAFAHGQAELQKLGYLLLQEPAKALAVETLANAAEHAVSSKKGFSIDYEQLGKGKKRFIWWDNVKQANGIYADWVDAETPL